MPDYSHRSTAGERIDDPGLSGRDLERSLRAIRDVNRLLGGIAATRRAVRPLLESMPDPVRILDLGTGIGDHAVDLVVRAASAARRVEVWAVDFNPYVLAEARAFATRQLPAALARHVHFAHADARRLPFESGRFEIAHAAMFLHHFEDPVPLLREMARVARHVVVNDLHRHAAAYLGFRAVTAPLPVPDLFREDGAVSVLRGFRREELVGAAREARLVDVRVRWHWAFRWTLVARSP